MDQPSLLIIGAGIAGLSCGCYAQMNGYSSRIYEMHTLPGGLCTSWRRKGYTFDGSLQYVAGSGEGAPAYRMWQELGIIAGRRFYHREELTRIEGRGVKTLVFYTDIDRLELHLKKLSPIDRGLIEEFIGALRQFAQFDQPLDMPWEEGQDPRSGLRLLSFVPAVLKWNGITLRDFAARFKDPFLREALPNFFQFAEPDFPMMIVLATLGMMHKHQAGYPLGGSLQFARTITRRYQALGGQIGYHRPVKRVLVEHGHAVGVRFADGSEERADIIISAADGHTTLTQFLEGRYTSPELRRAYEELPTAHPILQVSLGVNHDFSTEPPSLNFPLRQPRWIGGKLHERLVVKHYCYDHCMAPAGKSAVTVWIETDYDFWKALESQTEAYAAAKAQVARETIAGLEERFPGLAAKVEVIDVATPLTYERYTHTWRGAIHGWALTTAKMRLMMGTGWSKQLPNLENFYMIGQWMEPGGNVELSADSGRDLVRLLCTRSGQVFRTSLPGTASREKEGG